jgi:hypothetical protein
MDNLALDPTMVSNAGPGATRPSWPNSNTKNRPGPIINGDDLSIEHGSF